MQTGTLKHDIFSVSATIVEDCLQPAAYVSSLGFRCLNQQAGEPSWALRPVMTWGMFSDQAKGTLAA